MNLFYKPEPTCTNDHLCRCPNCNGTEEPNQPTLTREQLDRQDYVDNAIQNLLYRLVHTSINWDIEHIGKVRDAIQEVLCHDLELMTEQQFYPYIEES